MTAGMKMLGIIIFHPCFDMKIELIKLFTHHIQSKLANCPILAQLCNFDLENLRAKSSKHFFGHIFWGFWFFLNSEEVENLQNIAHIQGNSSKNLVFFF